MEHQNYEMACVHNVYDDNNIVLDVHVRTYIVQL